MKKIGLLVGLSNNVAIQYRNLQPKSALTYCGDSEAKETVA
ncbi:hypothetical protein Salpa_1485 [Sporomusa sp. KB1]|jgi:hypothetical protein|nr:hypothetical protein Salpa_1485 [Sporomusa sp. KB1]